MDDPRTVGTIQRLARYPVKSMLGEELDELSVGPSGVIGDRTYALIDTSDGTVASAKQPRKWGGLLHLRASYVDEPTADGPPSPVAISAADGTVVRSDDPDVDERLSTIVGRDVHLASTVPEVNKIEEVWPDIEGLAPDEFVDERTTSREATGERVTLIDLGMLAPGSFLDLCPLHVLTTSTLTHLRSLAPDGDFDWRRYRPNMLIDTDAAGPVENDWPDTELEVGEVTIRGVLATMRCVMTTLAQDGMEADRSTLRTLAEHNRLELPGLGRWACAGVYAVVATAGTVRTGDAVRLAPTAAS